jgi:hypothetical protein
LLVRSMLPPVRARAACRLGVVPPPPGRAGPAGSESGEGGVVSAGGVVTPCPCSRGQSPPEATESFAANEQPEATEPRVAMALPEDTEPWLARPQPEATEWSVATAHPEATDVPKALASPD